MDEKLTMKSSDLTQHNIKKLGEIFPNAVTEKTELDDSGNPVVKHAIDLDVLRQEVSNQVVEGKQQRYQFTWPDKNKAIILGNTPTTKTLRLAKEKSVGRDGTKGSIDSDNIYIEGDNLDVLKILRDTYLGKVKMIYIDPPYNTGNDFIYEDDFALRGEEYEEKIGLRDENGNLRYDIRVNNEASGRFHTDWLNMMYPRLRLARDLLTEDGVIFISIDDNEQSRLRAICDEVYGSSNFVATIVWQKIHSTKNDAKYFSENHEYAFVYARSIEHFSVTLLPRTDEMNGRYKNPDNDPRGPWQSGDLVASGERTNGHFVIKSPISGKEFDVPQGKHWVYSEANLRALVADNQIWFGTDGNAFPRKKRFLADVQDGRTPNTLWLSDEVGHNQTATREVKAIFDDEKVFDFPKPVSYIKQFVMIGTQKDAIVLDFFSGSATTAHAVMQLNAEDGGHRKFIMVQLPEPCDQKSEAYKAGYKTICDIGEERIRRAGKKILEESKFAHTEADKSQTMEQMALEDGSFDQKYTFKTNPAMSEASKNELDVGFRVFYEDESNMKDVFYHPDEIGQLTIDDQIDNIKPDRTPEDLLFQCMLSLGVFPSSRIEEINVAGKKVFNVANNFLLACFDSDVNDVVVTEIAKRKPIFAVFRDSSFANDSVSVNFDQIFREYSPNTERKVI